MLSLNDIRFSTTFDDADLDFLRIVCIEEDLDFTDFEKSTKNIYIIARFENKLIGCSRIRIHPGNIYELGTVWVDKDYRSQGIAKQMINNLLSQIDTKIYLITDFENTKYYTKYGFVISDEIPAVLQSKFNYCIKAYPWFKIYLMVKDK